MQYLREKKMKIAQKDNDFTRSKRRLNFPESVRSGMLQIIENDVRWFQKNHIIDYSFLVGIHRSEDQSPSQGSFVEENLDQSHYYGSLDMRGQLMHRVESPDGREVYFVGIIDILNTSQ